MIAVTEANSRGDGAVFETQDSLRFVVTGARTQPDADAKLAAAGPDARIFAVRPDFSLPAAEWVAADPAFWDNASAAE